MRNTSNEKGDRPMTGTANSHTDYNGLTLPAHIETLFKVEPPVATLDDGYGFLGVVLRDTQTDKIQCHACGGWYGRLGRHVHAKHRQSLKDYRRQYGLPLEFPLCSVGLSRRLSAHGSKAENVDRLRTLLCANHQMKCSTQKRQKAMRYANNCAARKNINGLCDEQMLRRFLMVADIVGREPSRSDLVQHDHALCSAIGRRYRTINRFRRHHRFTVVAHNPCVPDATIIIALRRFHDLHSRIPRSRDFTIGTPNRKTILRHFGSWRRALAAAGFYPNEKEGS